MGRENHIFSVVPKMAVQAEVDWRLPVFEAGKYLVAFDGAALLLLELWRRDRGQRSGLRRDPAAWKAAPPSLRTPDYFATARRESR